MSLFLASLLTGAAVAVLTLAVLGLPVSLPRIGQRVERPQLFRHFEAEGVPVARGIVVSAAAGGGTFAVLWASTASVVVAFVPAAVVAAVPASYLSRRGRQRDKRRREAWPDALRGLVGSLQAGRSLHEALVDLQSTGPGPLRPVFARYRELTNLALPEVEALAAVRDELGEAVTDRIFEVLIVASDKGSRIALRVLKDLADSVTSDIQLVEKVQTADMELRMQSWAVFVIPWLTLVMVTSQPGDYRDYYTSPAGVSVLLVGSLMSLGGMVIVQRLGRARKEPRVLLTAHRGEGAT